MRRNIRTLFTRAAGDGAGDPRRIVAVRAQFVRKLSGFNAPSKANEVAFQRAVDEAAATTLIGSLVTNAMPRDRELATIKAKARLVERFRLKLPD